MRKRIIVFGLIFLLVASSSGLFVLKQTSQRCGGDNETFASYVEEAETPIFLKARLEPEEGVFLGDIISYKIWVAYDSQKISLDTDFKHAIKTGPFYLASSCFSQKVYKKRYVEIKGVLYLQPLFLPAGSRLVPESTPVRYTLKKTGENETANLVVWGPGVYVSTLVSSDDNSLKPMDRQEIDLKKGNKKAITIWLGLLIILVFLAITQRSLKEKKPKTFAGEIPWLAVFKERLADIKNKKQTPKAALKEIYSLLGWMVEQDEEKIITCKEAIILLQKKSAVGFAQEQDCSGETTSEIYGQIGDIVRNIEGERKNEKYK